MPRTLSANARRAIFAAQTGEVFVVLLELNHPSFGAPLRFCSDAVDTVSGGHTFVAFPFEFSLPDESDAPPARVTLKIDNVDRQIIAAVRSITGEAMTLQVSVVLASSPSTIEAGPFDFTVREVGYDSTTIEATLQYEDVLNDAHPGAIYAPNEFRGLF